MRHRVKGKKLSRTASHRKATMRALTAALIREHRIVTTVTKAKELRRFVEPIITKAKNDDHNSRKLVFASLQDKETVKMLFDEVGPKSANREGGYTRVIKIGHRQGDGADMAIIELVDYNDIKPEGGKTTKKKRTRRAGKSTPTAEPKSEANLVDESAPEAIDSAPQDTSAETESDSTSEKEE
jgi:large subunit ribosomal protein L17